MASDVNIRAIVTVLDRTIAPLHQINQRFNQTFAPLQQIGQRLAQLAEETGLTAIASHAGDAFGKVRALGGEILGLAGPLATLGAAGTIAGLAEMAKSAGEIEEKLALAAPSTGLAAQQLAGWHHAAELADVDLQQLDRGFQYLNRNIAEAAQGKAKDVEAILSQMGLHNTPGHLVSTADALKTVAAEAQHLVSSGHVQTADAMMSRLFGERSGMQLLPLFAQGPDQILGRLKEAQNLGLAPSDEDIKKGAAFEESYEKMSGAVEGLQLSIANGLFPALTPIVDKMTAWIEANQKWLASDINDKLNSIDWASIKDAVKDTADAFREMFAPLEFVAGHILGVRGTIIALVGISLAPMIGSFVELGAAVASTAAKFIIFPAAEFVGTLLAMVPAIGSAADAFAAFDLVLNANPVGAVVLALGALIAIGYEVYEHWEQITELWNGLPEPVKAAIAAITSVLDPFIALPLELYENWNKLVGLFDKIGSFFSNLGTTLGNDYAMGMGLEGMPGYATPLTALPGGGPSGMPAGAAAQQSSTKVTVDFKNLPPNVQPSVETQGNPDFELTAGYAFGY